MSSGRNDPDPNYPKRASVPKGWMGSPTDYKGMDLYEKGQKAQREISNGKSDAQIAKEKAAKKHAMKKLGERFSDRAKGLMKNANPKDVLAAKIKKASEAKIPASPTH